MPALAAIGRTEKRRVFNSRVDRVRIFQRRFEVPHALEFPRMLRSVVPLVRGERLAALRRRIVDKLVALAFGHSTGCGGRFARRRARLNPGLASIVGALNHLPEPVARLRGEDAVRVNRRALQVIHRPARKKRAAHVPLFALAIRRQNECAFARAHQYAYFAHPRLLVVFFVPRNLSRCRKALYAKFCSFAVEPQCATATADVPSDHRRTGIMYMLMGLGAPRICWSST